MQERVSLVLDLTLMQRMAQQEVLLLRTKRRSRSKSWTKKRKQRSPSSTTSRACAPARPPAPSAAAGAPMCSRTACRPTACPTSRTTAVAWRRRVSWRSANSKLRRCSRKLYPMKVCHFLAWTKVLS